MTTKKEKPIIFSTPMVKAILAGNKTMTRRIIKPQPDKDAPCIAYSTIEGFQTAPEQADEIWVQTEEGQSVQLKPRYKRGDVLWVRETFTKASSGDYIYRANSMFDHCGKGDISWNWTPTIFMPREAARIFLKVINVRIERLREITAEDKVREGFCDCCRSYPCVEKDKCGKPCFMKLWDTLNAKRGYGWDSNPWVWVIEFEQRPNTTENNNA